MPVQKISAAAAAGCAGREPHSRLCLQVAHDINALAGTIEGYAGLSLKSAPAGSRLARDLAAILECCARAARLSRDLVALGGERPPESRSCSLSELAGQASCLRVVAGRGALRGSW